MIACCNYPRELAHCASLRVEKRVTYRPTIADVDTELGLRERKKIATKTALHEAAMRLAVADGYDTVTVEAIADAAGVSRRTFSNYFTGKEEALLHGDSTRLASLLDSVEARPAEESAWPALRAGTDLVLAELQRRHLQRRDSGTDAGPGWLTRARLIRSHPALLAEQVATYASCERALAEEIERRLPGHRSTSRARVVAACFLAALRVGIQTWLDQPGDLTLRQCVDRALAEAGENFG